MNKYEEILAWKWMTADMCFRHGDGRKFKKKLKYSVIGTIQACSQGFHASRKIAQSLSYRGDMKKLCLVRLSGDMDEHSDKIAARTIELIEVFHVYEKFIRNKKILSNLVLAKKLELFIVENASKDYWTRGGTYELLSKLQEVL